MLTLDGLSKIKQMTDATLTQLAQRQLADYDRGRPGTAFADGLQLSVADAYRVQSLVGELREARGERRIGYKVGCTSPVIRRRLGIDHPVFGRLYENECWRSGARLPPRRLSKLAIEGELAVRLARDLPPFDTSAATVSATIDSVFPVIELHDFVFNRGDPSPDELIANNAMHVGFVYSTNPSPSLGDDPATLRIDIDDVRAATVSGEELTRTVVDSLAWLARELSPLGDGLQAGQTVLCGSIADLIPVAAECRISVTTDRFGSVTCSIARPDDRLTTSAP